VTERSKRFDRAEVKPDAEEVLKTIRAVKGVERAEIAGSYRREKPTVGDIDILVVTKNPEKISDTIAKLPMVRDVVAHGGTKLSFNFTSGLRVDVRFVSKDQWGSALPCFTKTNTHFALLVANDNRNREVKATTTGHNTSNAADRDDLLIKFRARALGSTARRAAFATTWAASTRSAEICTCFICRRCSVNNRRIHDCVFYYSLYYCCFICHIFVLKFEPTCACCVRKCCNAPTVAETTTIKNYLSNSLCLCALCDFTTELYCAVHLFNVSLLCLCSLGSVFLGITRDESVSSKIIHQLCFEVTVGLKDTQTWACWRTRNTRANLCVAASQFILF
jgi:predicted nucleotidyltransferase